MVECCMQNMRQNGRISRGASHATTTEHYQYTTSVDINNTRYKRIQSLIQNHMPMCTVSLLESREQYYIKAMNDNNNNFCHTQLSPKAKKGKQEETDKGAPSLPHPETTQGGQAKTSHRNCSKSFTFLRCWVKVLLFYTE